VCGTLCQIRAKDQQRQAAGARYLIDLASADAMRRQIGEVKAAPAAPLARLPRRALPLDARPAQAGPLPRRRSFRWRGRHAGTSCGAAFVASKCPARGGGRSQEIGSYQDDGQV